MGAGLGVTRGEPLKNQCGDSRPGCPWPQARRFSMQSSKSKLEVYLSSNTSFSLALLISSIFLISSSVSF